MSTNSVPPPPNFQQQVDYAKWLAELKRRDAERSHDRLHTFHDAVNEAAIKSGELALRMALLINGGAAIALLTFIGTLPKEQKRAVADTLVWFGSGVGLAVLAIAGTYFTNYFMLEIASSKLRRWEHPYVDIGPNTAKYEKLNIGFHLISVALGVASVVAFAIGLLCIRTALKTL
jgi:hypothetical protein